MPKHDTPQDINWLLEVILAMRDNDGSATLDELRRWVEHRRGALPTHYDSVISTTIYTHASSDSPAYVQGNPKVFRKLSLGKWGLRKLNDPADTLEPTVGVVTLRAHAEPFVLQQMADEEVRALIDGRSDALDKFKKRVATEQVRLLRKLHHIA
jgi:hypothetical protein